MNTKTVLVALLLAAAAVLGTSCQPHEVAAWRAVHDHRVSVQNNSFLACVRAHESAEAGLYSAQNPRSSASGAYQFLDSTWRVVANRAGHGNYARAIHAPWYVQDAVAYDTAIRRGERYHWSGTGC